MTDTEERLYLETLLLESARWRVSEDDVYSPIEREIMDRLRRLNGIDTVDDNGYVQSDLPNNLPAEDEPLTSADFQALEAARLNEHLASVEKVKNARSKWERDKVRVYIDGKHVWKPRAECMRQLRDNSKGGPAWKWVWVGKTPTTVGENLPTKAEQCDAMWAEHEQEGK